MKLRIAIAGTRGIPNQYGGFEQFAQCLSKGLVERGHLVTVYNTHDHPYQNNEWNGVEIIHRRDLKYLGTAGQFIYDLNCIRHARKRKFDVLLILGYTSSSVWGKWFPKKTVIATNMDGMEWKRSKYSKPVQSFLRYAEKLAIRFSHCHIADSVAVKQYLESKYGEPVRFISYGSEIPSVVDDSILLRYGLAKDQYYLLIARMEPENNIEVILDGVHKRNDGKKMIVVGNTENKFGRAMKLKFVNDPHIVFVGAIYERAWLDSLRANCLLYFHGHSVGGTNPSLLEAMSCGAVICAHDNEFNRSVLGEDAYWFNDAEGIAALVTDQNKNASMTTANLETIRKNHSWEKIIDEYESLFLNAY